MSGRRRRVLRNQALFRFYILKGYEYVFKGQVSPTGLLNFAKRLIRRKTKMSEYDRDIPNRISQEVSQ